MVFSLLWALFVPQGCSHSVTCCSPLPPPTPVPVCGHEHSSNWQTQLLQTLFILFFSLFSKEKSGILGVGFVPPSLGKGLGLGKVPKSLWVLSPPLCASIFPFLGSLIPPQILLPV